MQASFGGRGSFAQIGEVKPKSKKLEKCLRKYMDEADPMHILMYVTQLYIWEDTLQFYIDAVTNCEPQEKLKEMIEENVNGWTKTRQMFDDWRYADEL